MIDDLIREVNDILLAENREFGISYRSVWKNNEYLDAITYTGVKIAPLLYFDKDDFMEKGSRIVADIVVDFFEEHKMQFDIDLIDRDYILDNVYPRLVSNENEDGLEDYVKVPFLDMYVLFYVIVPPINECVSSFTLYKLHLETYDISLQEIIAASRKHYEAVFELHTMSDLLSNLGWPVEIPFEDCLKAYIGTNKWKLHGASVMWCDNIMSYISEDVIGDYLIVLPSSVHEVIIVPVGMITDLREMLSIVKEVNSTLVSPIDRLTNSVYIYDGEIRKWNS